MASSATATTKTAVRAATSADPDVREVWKQQEQLLRRGYGDILDVLAARQPLRPGLTTQVATDVMLVLLGPDVYRAHTQDNGWTPRQYAAWTVDALDRLLFDGDRSNTTDD